jgi:tetratricopeptide (TPR) repeat protein
MPEPNELKDAMERLLAGTASDADRNALRNALANGVLVTGERAVAVGGDASDVIITTGDQNIVLSFKGADAATVQEALTSIAPTRLHQVPPPPADFTGRKDELEELLAAIEQGGVTISGLQGLGGIGKTALALKLVEELKPSYPDAQFYLDLKGASNQPLTVSEALAHVVRAYHPAAKLPDIETELRALYLSVLNGQRAILLMDNAKTAEQVEPLIPPAGCVLLVTSRWHFTLPGLAAKSLDTLTAEDACALLLAMAPRIGEWVDEIAKLCGYLPLALRLAAGALAQYRNLKPADYARRLQGTQQRLQLIEASLSLSYDLLSEELRERWRWLAVFTDSFADYSASAVWGVEVDQAQQTLGELLAASMLEWNETTDRYRLHDLARLFADAELNAGERTTGQKRHATHYKDILAAADDLYLQGGEALARGLALFNLEWANIQVGHAWVATQGFKADEDVARLGMAYPASGVYLLLLRQNPRERIRWSEIALAAAQRLKDRANEGATLGFLGIAYADLRETKRAIPYFEQHLVITRELNDRRGEGTALGNLGSAYYLLGDTKRAIQFYEERLVIARELRDRRGEGNVLANLGNTYADMGETKRAIQFYEQQLTIARELGERRSEGMVLGYLGDAYADLGETKRALQFYEPALLILRELGDRRGEGSVLWSMSLVLHQLGNRAQAIQYAEQSLIIREQIEDPRAATVRAQLTEWREEAGQD